MLPNRNYPKKNLRLYKNRKLLSSNYDNKNTRKCSKCSALKKKKSSARTSWLSRRGSRWHCLKQKRPANVNWK